MTRLRITEHSIERFRERIEPNSNDNDIIVEMVRCLSTARAKHFASIGARTFYIPTYRAVFVGSGDAIVTVLRRDASLGGASGWPHGAETAP